MFVIVNFIIFVVTKGMIKTKFNFKIKGMKIAKTYKMITSDEDDLCLFDAYTDNEAMNIAEIYCDDENVTLFNLFEVNEDYEEIRTIF